MDGFQTQHQNIRLIHTTECYSKHCQISLFEQSSIESDYKCLPESDVNNVKMWFLFPAFVWSVGFDLKLDVWKVKCEEDETFDTNLWLTTRWPVRARRLRQGKQCTPSYTDKIFLQFFMPGLDANWKCDRCQFHWLRGDLDVAIAVILLPC